MNIISLFDGLGGARLALSNLNIKVDNYFAFEIEESPIKVSSYNFPDIIHLGDIRNALDFSFPSIDLVIFGSPCTQLSRALIHNNKGVGLSGQDSSLFWIAVDVLRKVKPSYFLCENVNSMTLQDRAIITRELAVEPLMIDSATLTAQTRKRLYWTNLGVSRIEPSNIILESILEDQGIVKNYILSDKALKMMNQIVGKRGPRWNFENHSDTASSKSRPILANIHKGVPMNCLIDRRCDEILYRHFTTIELERLQGLPDNYTEISLNGPIFKTHRQKMIGNGFTIPIIEHLLKSLNL